MAYDNIFDNHLYDRNFFQNEILQTLPHVADPEKIFHELEKIGKGVKAGDVEASLDIGFTAKILDVLGWPHAYQQRFKFHGNKKIPDFLLFQQNGDREAFVEAPRDEKPLDKIFSVWEDKAENVPLDNGKTDAGNPYFQLMEYLTFLRLPFGFLGNGHEIWYVDNSEIFTEKRYLALNFDRLLASRNVAALRVFLGIFGRPAHVAKAGEKSAMSVISSESRKRRQQSEEELRNAVYGLEGRESLFEKCGAFLYASQPVKNPGVLKDLYKNCLYFTFRLIFIAFFEVRHGKILKKHTGYQSISLETIYQKAKRYAASGNDRGFEAWNSLQLLFRTLDEGNRNLDIPLFNGGLFARHVAAMLDQPRMMGNCQLLELLDMLYGETETGYIRDFSALSVIQFGRIYESLLEYEFRLAEENLWYLEYRQKKDGKLESIDGYYDTEDYRNILKDKGRAIIGKAREYKKGEVYLVGGKNSRKQSASYYTPQSLSGPLVSQAIEDAAAKLQEGESLLDLKILDNACGSGHLLVDALQCLTRLALDRLGRDARLKAMLEDEKLRIQESLADLGLASQDIEVDELAVLKRILLKKTLYGVDLQPFAVELARLSLWIETFVFGTPHSFIEHHIKSGNSLLGCSLARVEAKLNQSWGNLWDNFIKISFAELNAIFEKLSLLQDTTPADIIASKNIYQSQIRPKLEEMRDYFDMFNAADMLLAESFAARKMAGENALAGHGQSGIWKNELLKAAAEKKEQGDNFIKKYGMLAQTLHERLDGWREIQALLRKMRKRYAFFNWQLEFPEVFAASKAPGFHVIIGNPPWDKTKFSDPDFFSQYRSNYRRLSNSKKRAVMAELFAKPFIRERYARQYGDILAVNEYFKEHFPCSQGAGDGNLFRFFVEKNLTLLRKGGTLNYVIPTALWTDEGSTALRRLIFEKFRLKYFYGFENRELLFPDVHARYKFGLMQIERLRQKLAEKQKGFQARFMLLSPSQLADAKGVFTYGLKDVAAISPGWMALMEFRSGQELEIMRKLHGKGYGLLDPAWIDFRNELHASNDKKIFHEQYAEGMIMLYRGACVWQYDSQYWLRAGRENANEYWLKPSEMDQYLLPRERRRLVEDIYPQLPVPFKKARGRAVLDALGLQREADLDRFIAPDRQFPRLAFRAIASDTNERTMISAILPPDVGAPNSLWVSIPKRYVLDGKNMRIREYSLEKLFFAQAFFNSLVFDWALRCSVAINVNKTYVWRIPMPQPQAWEIRENPVYMGLLRNSLRLSAYYNEQAFFHLFEKFGMTREDRIDNDKTARICRREIDLVVINAYGLNREDMAVILNTFTVMNKNFPSYGPALLENMRE